MKQGKEAGSPLGSVRQTSNDALLRVYPSIAGNHDNGEAGRSYVRCHHSGSTIKDHGIFQQVAVTIRSIGHLFEEALPGPNVVGIDVGILSC